MSSTIAVVTLNQAEEGTADQRQEETGPAALGTEAGGSGGSRGRNVQDGIGLPGGAPHSSSPHRRRRAPLSVPLPPPVAVGDGRVSTLAPPLKEVHASMSPTSCKLCVDQPGHYKGILQWEGGPALTSLLRHMEETPERSLIFCFACDMDFSHPYIGMWPDYTSAVLLTTRPSMTDAGAALAPPSSSSQPADLCQEGPPSASATLKPSRAGPILAATDHGSGGGHFRRAWRQEGGGFRRIGALEDELMAEGGAEDRDRWGDLPEGVMRRWKAWWVTASPTQQAPPVTLPTMSPIDIGDRASRKEWKVLVA